ncbi:hypothetical protein EKO04_006844 [Ascochyta lentis]|uniref:Uncharacterized protein n=1 Tax=Ascochyta lentis TaxID=205686 RepID=A0A8H7MHD9_9PLEO|nr:hypothetical protein EKO04_006844 [Ascochyta lentis]
MARGGPKYTIQDYVSNMKDPRFTFSPYGVWNKVHGDGKSITYGSFVAFTQASSTVPPVYLVMVKKGKDVVLVPFAVKRQLYAGPPPDADVVLALRAAVGLEEE